MSLDALVDQALEANAAYGAAHNVRFERTGSVVDVMVMADPIA